MVKKENQDVRDNARIKDVPHWMIAREVGVTASTFSVWLRTEMAPERKAKVLAAIDAIAAREA